jgi:hypothetical protein
MVILKKIRDLYKGTMKDAKEHMYAATNWEWF